MIDIAVLNLLNAPTREERIANLKEVLKTTTFPEMVPQYINNHIHTTYSFSPYSPTAAVYAARMEGLCTAGIIDHDSISGAEEFLEAIDTMMDDEDWRAAAAKRSEEIAASFDKKAFGEAIETVYESVL